jgi:hypothetical protein
VFRSSVEKADDGSWLKVDVVFREEVKAELDSLREAVETQIEDRRPEVWDRWRRSH